MTEIGTVERAFQLASSGQCGSVDEVRRLLRNEGLTDVQAHLGGTMIVRQLRRLIASARSEVASG